MRVLIRETLETTVINIYGTDGKQHSKDFFEKYFADSDGAYSTLDEEREEFGTDAQWTIITRRDFDLFAGTVETLQKAIDSADRYPQDSDSYLI